MLASVLEPGFLGVPPEREYLQMCHVDHPTDCLVAEVVDILIQVR